MEQYVQFHNIPFLGRYKGDRKVGSKCLFSLGFATSASTCRIDRSRQASVISAKESAHSALLADVGLYKDHSVSVFCSDANLTFNVLFYFCVA